MAPREDGLWDPVGLGGGEDEPDVGRRLLEGLKQGVEGRPGEHVYLVYDVELAAAFGGDVLEVLLELAHTVDLRVGGSVDLDDVGA